MVEKAQPLLHTLGKFWFLTGPIYETLFMFAQEKFAGNYDWDCVDAKTKHEKVNNAKKILDFLSIEDYLGIII